MSEYLLPYEALLAGANSSSLPLTQYLLKGLPDLWHEAYLEMTQREPNILIFTHGTFDLSMTTTRGWRPRLVTPTSRGSWLR